MHLNDFQAVLTYRIAVATDLSHRFAVVKFPFVSFLL